MKTANRTLWTPGRCLFANLGLFASAFALILSGVGAGAQTVNLAKAPLLTQKTAPGLVLLTMGRDLPLFKAAYNDVNDLDGDNIPDLFFKPSFRGRAFLWTCSKKVLARWPIWFEPQCPRAFSPTF